MEAWLEALAEVAQQQPALLSKAARLRLAVGSRGSDGAKAWSIACDPTHDPPIVVRALGEAENDHAPYDCQLYYQDEEIWRGVQSGAVNPRTAMNEKKMTMKGSFRTIMGMRKLFAAASALATGGEYKVTIEAAGRDGAHPAALGHRRRHGGASCCTAPVRGAPDAFLVRVVRINDNAVGEGIRTAAECTRFIESLPGASVVAAKPLVLSAATLERELARLLIQASLPGADPVYAAVWSFVRLQAPETVPVDGIETEDRVAAADAEAEELRKRIAELESCMQRRESPLYSAAATIGMGWVVLPLAVMAYQAVAAQALALVDGSVSAFPEEPEGFLILLSIVAGLRLVKWPKARAAIVICLLLVVKFPSWLGLPALIAASEDGSATAGTERASEALLGRPSVFLRALASLPPVVYWLVAWTYPAVLVCAFGLSVAYWRLPRESPRRRRGAMYAMFWGCGIRYLLCWLRTKGFDEDSEYSRAMYANTHAAIAEDMYMTMSQLRGFWVKLGQYISTRADMALPAYTKKFKVFQDENDTAPFEEIKELVEDALGCPLEEVFESFEETALASASIAQVHKAVLRPEWAASANYGGRVGHNWTTVAVKVRHKTIAETLKGDLTTLRAMLGWQGMMLPSTDFRPMIDEWSGEVAKELDFTLEAANQARIGQLLEQFDGSQLSVPTLHPALGGSAGKVPDPSGVIRRNGMRGVGATNLLVMEFIEGERVTDGAEAHLDYDGKVELMERLIAAYARLMFVDGVFQADPHPGNLLLTKSPSGKREPVLLDFGLTKYLPTHARRGLAMWVLAIEAMDVELIQAAMKELGMDFIDGQEPDGTNLKHMAPLFGDMLPGEQQREANMNRMKAMRAERKFKNQRGPPFKKMSGDVMLFMRSYMLLRGMGSSLNVTVPVMKHLAKHARIGLENVPEEAKVRSQ